MSSKLAKRRAAAAVAAAAATEDAPRSRPESQAPESVLNAALHGLLDEADDAAPGPASWVYPVLVGCCTLALYTTGVFPSVPGGDATELAFAACQLSVPHPPGYPLWTLVQHAFIRLLPLGSPIYRANVAAAACAACAAAVLCAAVLETTRSPAAAVLSAGIFALAPLVWFYALQAEVFALNNALVAALLLFAARFERTGAMSDARAAAVTAGLAMCNMHTAVFHAAPLALLALLGPKGAALRRPGPILSLIACAFLGLLPHVYLPWASARGLPGSWGDTTTLAGFVTHILRREYGTLSLFSGDDAPRGRLADGLWRYAAAWWRDSRALGAPLTLVGAALALTPGATTRWPGARSALASLVVYTVAFHALANLPLHRGALFQGVHARFWLQSHVGAAALAGVGAAAASRAAGAACVAAGIGRAIPSRTALAAGVGAVLAASAAVSWPVLSEGPGRAMLPGELPTDAHFIREYGAAVLAPLPKGSRLIIKGDLLTNTVRYLQVCEAVRPDVQVLDQSMATYPWFPAVQARNVPNFTLPFAGFYHPRKPGGYSMKQLLDENLKSGVVFMAGGWHEQDDSHEGHYRGLPIGLLEWVVPMGPNGAAAVEEWLAAGNGTLPTMSPPGRRYSPERWEAVAVVDFYHAHVSRANALLNLALERAPSGDEPRLVSWLQEAAYIYDWVFERHPPPKPNSALRNAGITWQHLFAFTRVPETRERMVAAFAEYLEGAPADAPGLDNIQKLVDGTLQF